MKKVFTRALTLLLAVSMLFVSACGKENPPADTAVGGESTTAGTVTSTTGGESVTSTTDAATTTATATTGGSTTTATGTATPTTAQTVPLTKPTKTGTTEAKPTDPTAAFLAEFEGWLDIFIGYTYAAPTVTKLADGTVTVYELTSEQYEADYCVHVVSNTNKSIRSVYVTMEKKCYDYRFPVLAYYVYSALGLTQLDSDTFIAQFDAFPNAVDLQNKSEGNYRMACATPDEFLSFVVFDKGVNNLTTIQLSKELQAASCGACYGDVDRSLNYLALTENADELGIDISMLDRALVAGGNRVRLANVMRRALKGEEITIGYIGGSVTEGAYASDYEKTSYAGLSYAWWVKTFPKATFRFVNAGYGGTSSLYGVHRVEEDLLKYEPDFVVVEFGVNDCSNFMQKEAYANLVHRILSYPSTPAVMLLYVMSDSGGNVQDDQIPVGLHYDLPMISYRDAVWPEVASGRIEWAEIGADYVHPTNQGHAMIAELIISYLTKTYADLDAIETTAPAMPKPYVPYVYENAVYLNRNNLTPLSMSGFRQVSNNKTSWMGSAKAKITLAFTGKRCFLIVPTEYKDNLDVSISIDGGPSEKLDAYIFHGGAFANFLVFDDDAVAKHTIEITCNSGSLYISGLFVS